LARAVEEKIQGNRWFTISSLSLRFPQISRSLLHEIMSDKLRFRKLCSPLNRSSSPWNGGTHYRQ
jgi:hypothetical protein